MTQKLSEILADLEDSTSSTEEGIFLNGFIDRDDIVKIQVILRQAEKAPEQQFLDLASQMRSNGWAVGAWTQLHGYDRDKLETKLDGLADHLIGEYRVDNEPNWVFQVMNGDGMDIENDCEFIRGYTREEVIASIRTEYPDYIGMPVNLSPEDLSDIQPIIW